MNKDQVEGTLRSAIGQGEKVVGQAMNDPNATAQGIYDDVAGKARSALGSAEDAVSRGADAISAVDVSALREQVSKFDSDSCRSRTKASLRRAGSGGRRYGRRGR